MAVRPPTDISANNGTKISPRPREYSALSVDFNKLCQKYERTKRHYGDYVFLIGRIGFV